MDKRRWLRFSIRGMLVLVALVAIALAYVRSRGTQITDVKIGSGPAVKSGDTVVVHYVGRLADGKTFDSSKPRGAPFEFTVAGGMVIRGWDQGLIGMRKGGLRRLVIPPDEAYGEKGAPPVVPPNATLRFEVELLQIK